MDYYEKDKEYKKDKGHKKSGFWHILGAFVLGGILLLSLLFFFNRPVAPAFGSLYGDDTLETDVATVDRVEFEFEGPALNTDPDAVEDEIVIETSGVYEITADVIVTAGAADFDIVVLDENGDPVEIPASNFAGAATPNPADGTFVNTIGKTITVNLEEGYTVFVEVEPVPPGVSYVSAALTVERVGPPVDTE